MVSLRSNDNPNHYLVIDAATGNMEVRPYECTASFFLYATFELMPGRRTGLCNYTGVSFRCVYPGFNYYITANGGILSVEPEIIGSANGLTDDMQTFAIDWEEDSAPTCM